MSAGAAAASAAAAAAAAAAAGDAPVVATTAGRYSGLVRPGSTAFLGIPFAEAPVGERRFRAPVRAAAFEGVRPATAYGATPQRRPFGALTTVPEPSIPGPSTLNVNVFTPAAGQGDARLPVLVWIHGGGYFAGSPASPWYDGRSFNRDGVVTVTVSYRLGFDGFGWMAGAPLNRGVLDQIAALEWVQENIRAFGGDPDRVTIAGQSAGGGSVLTLLAAPGARGLFHGAISESGVVGRSTAADAEEVGRRFASALGIEPTLDAWREIAEDRVLDHERDFNTADTGVTMQSPPTDLIAATRSQGAGSLAVAFAPVVDGETVLDVASSLAAGASSGLPLLLGTTRNEFTFPSRLTADSIESDLAAAGVSRDARRDYRERVDVVGRGYANSQLVVEQMFRGPALHLAAVRSAAGAGDRTWLYDYAHVSPATGNAAHCHELPFVFDLLDAEGVEAQLGATPPRALADAMHSAWVRFVTEGRAAWPSVAVHPTGALVFDTASAYDEADYRLTLELVGG
ncbi:carboxylesterase/lipase family protein [Frondihabitans cladoniiphilus]|uniref:Carboxylic ester hydrolase n=1 Tax=Frondihabitans cladoniiphilus TaxID=715785 RepID=A0ABP8VJN4_9MICO